MTPIQRAMCDECAAMMREFYKDPENERKFQEWKNQGKEGARRSRQAKDAHRNGSLPNRDQCNTRAAPQEAAGRFRRPVRLRVHRRHMGAGGNGMAEVDAKAQALVAKACGWVASNPDTWAKLRRICYRLMLEGHVIQRDNVYTLACQNGMTVSEASEFKRDHNLWSVLSRYMVLQRPSMLAAVSFRRTPVDSVDLVGTWEAIVGPAVFAASTLTEAQGIYDRGAQ